MKTSAIAAIALAGLSASAVPTIVSPADYATVKTVSDKLYSDIHTSGYFTWSTFQQGTETGTFRQTGMAEYKTNSLPVRLQWSGTSGSCTVTARRSRDNVAVFSTTTTGTSATFYDPEVGRNYTWTVENGGSTATGHFFTELRAPRIIYSDHDPSAQGSECSIGRDLGGWVTEDGAKVVKQGLIYRSAMMEYCNPGVERRPCDELSYLKDVIGIKLDIDLREVDWMNNHIIGHSDFEWSWGTLSINMSNIGAGIPRFNVNQVCGVKFPDYGGFTSSASNKKAVWCAFTNFCSTARLPAIFHCAHGKDRTGSLAYVLLGALGVSEEDARRDFGLSWYADAKDDVYMTSSAGYPSLKTSSTSLYNKLPSGSTFQARCEAYLLSCGTAGAGLSTAAAQAKIDAFKALMLEDLETAATPPGDPEPVVTEVTLFDEHPEWGYKVEGLGAGHDEIALVFTNQSATASWTVSTNLTNIQFLVVGGGGGGGADINPSSGAAPFLGGGGGGGGGVVTGVVSTVALDTVFSIKVGAGGAGGTCNTTKVNGGYGASYAGGASTLSVGGTTVVTAYGGGNDTGTTGTGSTSGQVGGTGGSNAGSRAGVNSAQGAPTQGSVASSFVSQLAGYGVLGNVGGNGHTGTAYYGSQCSAAGGGGGATEAGATPADYTVGGNGGEGLASDITGTSAVYGSGGGGGTIYRNLGGTGGTGAGNGNTITGNGGNGQDALANEGGGGGGGGRGGNGGAGGSGIVVLRFRVPGTEPPVEPEVPDIAITTNALPTASWGYTVNHLGEFHNETAVVFTNGTATWTAPETLENVRFLVVGGGGGGGGDVNAGDGYQGGAGGGGGGVVTGVVYSVAQGATVLTTVGAGGAAGKAGTAVSSKYGAGKAGSASSFKVGGVTYVTANGGGQDGGSTTKYSTGGQAGGSGGSSAGSRPQVTERGTATKGSIGSSATSLLTAALFGNQGGGCTNGVNYVSAGGGGATEEGGTPSDYMIGGKGGEGLASDITGTSAVYGSGGGGGTAVSAGVGGLGGTGAGDGHRTGKGKGENALPNQGGGGGGGGGQANGGSGGSGIVVLRYVAPDGVIVEAEVSAKVLNPDYTGGVVSCGLAETAGYTVSGATATDVGDYTATVTPKAGYVWDDGTMGAKTFSWSVAASTPQVAGENVAPAEVFTKAKASKPIVYPTEPTVTGDVGAQVISFGGVDVNVPDYYTASKSGNVVSLVLNDNAKPVITDEDETPGIVIVDGKVHIHLGNVKSALYYTILSATSLDAGEWTPCGEAEQGQDDFEYNASGPVRFYKASVRDEAE